MAKVVLSYFPIKGLAEALRMLLAYGGQEFEDRRITEEEWPEYKSKMPFGTMPVLEIDGKQYAQSMAIARYLARQYGLAGDDLEEAFEIDQNASFSYDVFDKAAEAHYEEDEDAKERKHQDFSQNVYPGLLAKLNDIVVKNNGHLACGKLTYADFIFAGLFDYLKMMMRIPDLETKYPSFKKLVDSVISLPKVKAWIATAPKCEV